MSARERLRAQACIAMRVHERSEAYQEQMRIKNFNFFNFWRNFKLILVKCLNKILKFQILLNSLSKHLILLRSNLNSLKKIELHF